MALDLPKKEHLIYSQLMTVEALMSYIKDHIADSAFDNLDLISDIDKARLSIHCAQSHMIEIMQEGKAYKSACY